MVPADIFPWNSNSLPWHVEYVFQAMFYMVLGYMFRHNFEINFDKYNTKKTRILIVIIYIISVFVPFFGRINMHMLVDIIYQYFKSILGIAALISIAKVIKANKYINYVGQNTLIYFVLHGKILSIIQMFLKKFVTNFYSTVLNNVLLSSLFCLVFSLLLSVILIIPAYIINRWFPFIVGRKSIITEKR